MLCIMHVGLGIWAYTSTVHIPVNSKLQYFRTVFVLSTRLYCVPDLKYKVNCDDNITFFKSVFRIRIQMDPGFFADPDPDFKTRIRIRRFLLL